MLKHLIQLASRHGADVALLEVRPSNVAAVDLYRSLGFNEVGIRRNYYPADDGREDLAAETYRPAVYRVYRGGSFNDEAAQTRSRARGCSDAETQVTWRGFRVVSALG